MQTGWKTGGEMVQGMFSQVLVGNTVEIWTWSRHQQFISESFCTRL